MSKKQIKTFIITSIIWLVCLIAGITHSLLYNEGRWVVEMDLENLYFSVKDIPMLTVGVLTILWGIYVVMVAFKIIFNVLFPQDSSNPSYTKKNTVFYGNIWNMRFSGIFRFLDI